MRAQSSAHTESLTTPMCDKPEIKNQIVLENGITFTAYRSPIAWEKLNNLPPHYFCAAEGPRAEFERLSVADPVISEWYEFDDSNSETVYFRGSDELYCETLVEMCADAARFARAYRELA